MHEYTQWLINGDKGLITKYNFNSLQNEIFKENEEFKIEYEIRNYHFNENIRRELKGGKYVYSYVIQFDLDRSDSSGPRYNTITLKLHIPVLYKIKKMLLIVWQNAIWMPKK